MVRQESPLCAAKTLRRTLHAVYNRRRKLGVLRYNLTVSRPWTPHEIGAVADKLRPSRVERRTWKRVAKKIGRTHRAVKLRAVLLRREQTSCAAGLTMRAFIGEHEN